MSVVSMKQLLEAGAHFGHRTRRWDPKMKPYIFTERKGIHIIDLQKTLQSVNDAYDFIRKVSSNGGSILFVGTKKQAQQIVADEAKRCGGFYVNNRWLGGLLTNFTTIRKRINRLEELLAYVESEEFTKLPKKEQSHYKRILEKLEKNLGGLRGMTKLPEVMYVIDPRKEEIAIKEANDLGIPVVSIVDTNCDPDVIDWIIPANDDAIRAVMLITAKMSDAFIEGREGRTDAVQAPASAGTAEDIPEEIANKLDAEEKYSEIASNLVEEEEEEKK